LAFDVGTAYSNVAYCILDPGQVPEVKSVTRYPGKEHCSESSGIPTVIYYDQRGNVAAAGAEALREGINEQADDEGWKKAEWFKHHIRSKRGQGNQRALSSIPSLPVGKTVVQVFADFLSYLLRCARAYIQETHANGRALWESVEDDIDYVFAQPNAWDDSQQSILRKAVVLTGLISDDPKGHSQILFVTEGEASLHFANQNGLPNEALEGDNGVIVVDAGSSRIEISAYTSTFEEAISPQCRFHGSAFVSINFRLFLEEYLAESDFVEDNDHIVRCFDKTTKLRFANPKRPQYVKFGSTRDNDPDANIRFGQLKLNGSDVASFFSPSIKCIVDALKEVRKNSHKRFKYLQNAVLVGSFGANDWLYHQVAESSHKMGLSLYRPDVHQCEAFRAVGAVSSYLRHQVATHVARMAHQTEVTYEALKLEHFKGRNLMYLSTTLGTQTMRDYFRVIVPFVKTQKFKRRFYQVCNNREELSMFKAKVYAHRGVAEDGLMDENEDNYKQLCTITLDLSQMTPKQAPIQGQPGKFHYHLNYTLHIFFGSMGLKAQVGWMESVSAKSFVVCAGLMNCHQGAEKRSDGQIDYAE
ncbi:hypothetical protein BKA70DRAFT_1103304, partial [Coprinopsis sp. MPI-PUGE-AT-0042]